MSHVSPLQRSRPHRRGRLRPKVAARQPRAIPDPQWEELFAQMGCARDRALLACYVSSGARASELLGVGLADVDWHGGKRWVVSKGTRLRQPVPVSAEALACLAAYLDEAGLPDDGGPVWRTRRGLSRPLTYWAARRIIQRAAERLGMNWTLHDLRHTAATRMEVSRIASDATFSGSRERALPAVQRAALGRARSYGSPCTVRDLGCHRPLASGQTMMQPVRLHQIPA